MANTNRIQHEGIVKNISKDTLDVIISSHSACSGCHAKGACNMSDMKQKIVTTQKPEGAIAVGDKVRVYAAMNNAVYSVILAYVIPSVLIIGGIFLLEKTGFDELYAAIGGLIVLTVYFTVLYLFRNKIGKKIKFTVEKI